MTYLIWIMFWFSWLSNTSENERNSNPSKILISINIRIYTIGLLSRDMANSYYTIFQHKESLYDEQGASQPTTYQRLTSLKAERDLYADLDQEGTDKLTTAVWVWFYPRPKTAFILGQLLLVLGGKEYVHDQHYRNFENSSLYPL